MQFVDPPTVDETGMLHYTHPSGTFSLDAPRDWALYELNTTTLASAAFSAPGDTQPVLLFAVIDVGSALDETSFAAQIAQYQTQVRADTGSYTEIGREALDAAHWRASGIRRTASGNLPVNTFFQFSGSRLAVIEVTPIGPPDADRLALIEQIVNSLTLDPVASLESSDVRTLAYAKTSGLSIVHMSAWTAPDGALFVTGEVANYGSTPVSGIPVDVSLIGRDGAVLAGAVDTPMGYGIAPGGFAPFSLRFGEGQPVDGGDYVVRLGGDWVPGSAPEFSTPDELHWTDSSAYDAQQNLMISGQVSNTGTRTLRQLRAVATIFNDEQQVIGAVQIDLDPEPLAPGESRLFDIPVTALGDVPANYLVSVQGIP
ncbi:MAG: FxLYD domain-containing protein [Anaerolineae bacterium]